MSDDLRLRCPYCGDTLRVFVPLGGEATIGCEGYDCWAEWSHDGLLDRMPKPPT